MINQQIQSKIDYSIPRLTFDCTFLRSNPAPCSSLQGFSCSDEQSQSNLSHLGYEASLILRGLPPTPATKANPILLRTSCACAPAVASLPWGPLSFAGALATLAVSLRSLVRGGWPCGVGARSLPFPRRRSPCRSAPPLVAPLASWSIVRCRRLRGASLPPQSPCCGVASLARWARVASPLGFKPPASLQVGRESGCALQGAPFSSATALSATPVSGVLGSVLSLPLLDGA